MDCLAVRSDVPQEIVDKLNAMLDDVYADSKFTGFMDEMGYPLWDAKGDEVTKFIEDQMDSMAAGVGLFLVMAFLRMLFGIPLPRLLVQAPVALPRCFAKIMRYCLLIWCER